MNQSSFLGLIILILGSLIFSSYIIKDIFSTTTNGSENNSNSTTKLATASSRNIEIGSLSLFTNNSEYDALPFLYFLNYYINKTSTKIDSIICALILQEDAKKPIKISQISCDNIIVILPDNNSTKNYEISSVKEVKQLLYDNSVPYKFIMLSTLIDNINIENKLSYCGIIQKYNFEQNSTM